MNLESVETKKQSTSEFTYYAFISYKSENAEWARRLKKELQNYRLPIKTHRHHVDLPYRCTPIFLDKTNLTPGYLNEELREEVQSSLYLIMICSHYAYDEPKYLNAELQYYLDGGGNPDNVIPVIVEETDKPDENSYPSALTAFGKHRELNPIKVWEEGKRGTLLSLVARMHQISREELERDDAQRRGIFRFIYAAMVMVLIIGCFFAWDYFKLKTSYYLDYTEQYGVPSGIVKLKEKDIASMHRHYRIVESRGKVREIAYENSAGTLVEHSSYEHRERPSRMTYEYRDNGMINKVRCYDQFNSESYILNYTEVRENGAIVDLINGGVFQRSISYDFGMVTNRSLGNSPAFYEKNRGISRYWLFFDEYGYVTTRVNISEPTTNAIAIDADGISKIDYKRDSEGRIIRTNFFKYTGSDGVFHIEGVVSDFFGYPDVATVKYDYDSHGDLEKISFLSHLNNNNIVADEVPAVGIDGISTCICKYDNHHHQIKEQYFGTDDKPVNSWSLGYSSSTMEYDVEGNLVRQSFFGTDGKPVLTSSGAGYEISYDENGREKTIQALGTNGNPIMLEEGMSMLEFSYDNMGRVTRQSNYDTNGQKAYTKNGFASQIFNYDEKGNLIEEKRYKTDGVITIAYKKNLDGLAESCSFWGEDGLPTTYNESKCASIDWKYNDQRILEQEIFYGIDGKPVITTEYGCAGFLWEKREDTYIEHYLDENGKPMQIEEGYWVFARTVDQNGTILSASFLDEKEELVLSRMNYAAVVYTPDARGYSIPFYYGADLSPFICDGCAGYEVSVNQYGNIIRWLWIGEDGEASEIRGSAGYIAEYTFDSLVSDSSEFSNPVHMSCFSKEKVPELSEEHERRLYDRNGDLLRIAYYDEFNNPRLITDSIGSYSSIEYVYDDRGACTDIYMYGTDGKLVLNNWGFAHEHWEKNEDGDVISDSVFDNNDEAVFSPHYGYSSYVNEYDGKGNLTRVSYFGADGKPMLYNDGVGQYASIETEYDEQGNLIKRKFYGEDGQPILYANIYSEFQREIKPEKMHWSEGTVITERHLGINGELVTLPEGYAYSVSKFDERGNCIEIRFFDTDGEPGSGGNYGAGRKVINDNEGNIIRLDALGETTEENAEEIVSEEFDRLDNFIK